MATGSWIQKLYTSRDRNTPKFDQTNGNLGNTFVGEVGRLWYNPDTNCLYVSDGETPGGIPLDSCGNCNCDPNISVADEGNVLTTNVTSFNFVGEGVTATNVGNAVTVNVGAGIAYLYSGAFYFNSATTLTTRINSNTTAPIPVGSTAGFSNSGYIRINSEIIQYTGKTSTTFTGITRGQAGSQSAVHDPGAGISQSQVTSAGVPLQVLIDSTSISNNVTLDAATGNVTIGGAGTYNLQFSVQTENYGNDYDDTVVWFAINGNAVPTSASYCTVPFSHGGTPGSNIMTVNIFYTLVAGDVVALYWTSLGGTTTLSSIPPIGSTVPQSPSVIFTINRLY